MEGVELGRDDRQQLPGRQSRDLIKRRRGLVAIGQVAEALVTGRSRSGSGHRKQSSHLSSYLGSKSGFGRANTGSAPDRRKVGSFRRY
jgi:hypothetical protein